MRLMLEFYLALGGVCAVVFVWMLWHLESTASREHDPSMTVENAFYSALIAIGILTVVGLFAVGASVS